MTLPKRCFQSWNLLSPTPIQSKAFVSHKGVFTADAATGRASRVVGLGDLRPQEPLAYAADARLVAVGLTCWDGDPKVFGGPGHESFT